MTKFARYLDLSQCMGGIWHCKFWNSNWQIADNLSGIISAYDDDDDDAAAADDDDDDNNNNNVNTNNT